MSEIYETGVRLWAQWTEMWNGKPELARQLVGPRFALHLPLPSDVDGATVNDPASVERWVAGARAKAESLSFQYAAGPYVDVVAGVVAGPWLATVVAGGRTRLVSGMDTIHFEDGKIVEYWTVGKDTAEPGNWTTAVLAPR